MLDYEILYYEIMYDSKYCKHNSVCVHCEEDVLCMVEHLKKQGFTNIRAVKLLNIILPI